MSPKIVNGSFAAIYDATDVFEECMKNFGELRVEAKDSPGDRFSILLRIFDFLLTHLPSFLAMRRRIRGILMSGKQFSLDSRMDLVQVSSIIVSTRYNFIDVKTLLIIKINKIILGLRMLWTISRAIYRSSSNERGR